MEGKRHKLVRLQLCLQARLASQRLPGKVLLRLGDRTILEHAMRQLRQPGIDRYLLLTTDHDLPLLSPYAQRYGFICLGGDPENVLKRFTDALYYYPCHYLIRATADNPLPLDEPMRALISCIEHSPRPDYGFFAGLPYGGGVELVRSRALLQAFAGNPDSYQCEHVTPYLYQHPQRFRLYRPQVPPRWRGGEGIRLTLDTPQDLLRLQRIFAALYRNRPVDTRSLLAFVRQQRQLLQDEQISHPISPLAENCMQKQSFYLGESTRSQCLTEGPALLSDRDSLYLSMAPE